jgi:ribosome biogenesis GTPase
MPEPVTTLEILGWNSRMEECFRKFQEQGLEPGRIAVEDKHHYVVIAPRGELIGQVTGRLLHRSRSACDLPKVGDWVAFANPPDSTKVLIHHVLPRGTRLSRKVPGREVEEQVLAANIDRAFVVQALDRTFNPRLLQRHLVMAFESGARPVAVLNKADLCDDIPGKVAQAEAVAKDVPLITVSAKTGQGIERLRELIPRSETVVFIGSSGVGKSTLINDLCGEEVQPTAEVRASDAKGRHTTSWREMILLPNGGLVIDTPGMREFQMWVADEGMREAFADLDALALNCRFRDCTHLVEDGCAVLAALTAGQLPSERYRNYLKLKKELDYLEHAQTKHAWMQRRRKARVAQRAFDKTKPYRPF